MKPSILFKSLKVPVLLLLMAAVITFTTAHVYAAESENAAINQHVYDEAGLLSTTELEELEKMCIEYGEDAGVEIMILTHEDPNAVYSEEYIENFEDQLPEGDRVYLLIDMMERVVFIEGYGTAETYIHSKRINAILEEIKPALSNGNYFEACAAYIKSSATYMSDDSELNEDHDYTAGTPQSSNPSAPNYSETWPSDRNTGSTELVDIVTNVWVQLFASVAIGIITVSIMAYNSGGRMTAGSSNYINQGNSGLIGRRDDYIRTQVTRVRKPKNDNNSSSGGFNSGGFQGGTSSGGRSHSSGGSHF